MRILHVLLGIASLCAVATSSFADNKVYPGATQRSDGVWLSQVDNPIVQSNYTLNALEYSSRASNQWLFNNFDLFGQWACSANDPLCTPSSARQGIALNAWPAANGSLSPGQLLTVDLHGGAVGGLAAQYGLMRENSSEAINTVQNVSVQLAPETVVVPINAIVIMPSTAIADTQWIRDAMAAVADPDYQLALWDDVWHPSLQRTTHPGGILTSEGGQWTYSTTPFSSYSALGTFPIVSSGPGAPTPQSSQIQPDAVFAQCGIQFRLASMTVVNETTPSHVWFTKSGQETPQGGDDMICPGSFNAVGMVKDLVNDAQNVPPVFGTHTPFGINVIFSEYASNPGCAQTNGSGEALGVTSSAGVLLSQQDIFSGIVLSHELGHFLGLDHPDSADPTQCLGSTGKEGNAKNLMCSNVAVNPSPHIMGCDVWGTNPGGRYNCDVEPEDVRSIASCATAHTKALQLTGNMLESLSITPPTVRADANQLCYGPNVAPVTLRAIYSNVWDPYPVTITWRDQLGRTSTTTAPGNQFLATTEVSAWDVLGDDTFTVTVTDSLGFSASATETVTVVNSLTLLSCSSFDKSPAAIWQSTFGMPH